MRYTLEELKAMSDEELRSRWGNAQFPFENVQPCCRCLTGHHPDYETCWEHPELSKQMSKFVFANIMSGPRLREHLEELYALRLFYDSLYPPSEPSPAPAEVEEAVHAEA